MKFHGRRKAAAKAERDLAASAASNSTVQCRRCPVDGHQHPHHLEREQIIRDSGIPGTFLRPGMFMSNMFGWAQSINSQGAVFNALGDGKVAPIAPRDIAAVAVRALTTRELEGQVVDLTGDEALSTLEQVAILGRVLGRELRCIDISIETAVEGMLKSGLPPAVAKGLGVLYQRTRDGHGGFQTDNFERILGRKSTRFADWAREHAAMWPAGVTMG